MGQKSGPAKEPAEQVIREIRRSTRRHFSAEEKIRIVLSGLRGKDSIAELCRREGIVQNLYSKLFTASRYGPDKKVIVKVCPFGQTAFGWCAFSGG
jgi:transposase-like protein